VRDLADVVRRPGPDNDLLELSKSTLPFRDIAVGPVRVNGKQRRGAFPEAAESLAHSAGEWAFQRPYAVDLTGWFDDFSHSGLYDANGSASRVATSVPAFRVIEGLVPTLQFVPYDQRADLFRSVAMVGQNNRCPGAVERDRGDGSMPWRPSPDYNCNPKHVPLGP
jgi:phospholipid/cholesterol/gamma-HCH transport system substrate-binding protein